MRRTPRWARWLVPVGLWLLACRGEAGRGYPPKQEGKEVSRIAADTEEAAILLDSATRTRVHLRLAALRPATRPPEFELTAIVIEDPGASTTVRTGVGGRLSEAEGHSWPRVGDQLQGGTEIARVGDALPVTVPNGGTVTRILAQPGELVPAGQALLELTNYDAPIVRVSWAPEISAAPSTIDLSSLGSSRRIRARFVGPATQADPLTGGLAYLYRVSTRDSQLRPGASLIALLPDPRGGAGGLEVPNSAVVQWEALAWVYVERGPGRFVRVRVPTDHPLPGGWRVQQGLSVGDRVVVQGAGQLLSEEFRARIVVGEEVGE